MKTLLPQYRELIANPKKFEPRDYGSGGRAALLSGIGLKPTPSEISAFLQECVPEYEEVCERTHDPTEAQSDLEDYLSTLVQNSYDAGHNGFELRAEIEDFGYLRNVSGTRGNPLKLVISGSVYFALRSVAYVHAVLEEAQAGLASKVRHSYIEIKCITDFEEFASGTMDTVFVLNEMKNTPRSGRNYCVDTIDDETWDRDGLFPEDCVFKTTNRKTLAFLVEHVPTRNTVIYVPPSGLEVVERTRFDRPREF